MQVGSHREVVGPRDRGSGAEGSIPAYLSSGPGLVDGGEELVPDVGDTRIGIVPDLRRDYGTARVGYISVPVPPTPARGQEKDRKNRQDGQAPVNQCFSREKIFHVDPVFLFRIGDHRFRSEGAPTFVKEGAGIVPTYSISALNGLSFQERANMKLELTAVFRKVPEGYIAFIEELPGANTQGATLLEKSGCWRRCGRYT
jgi:hypothetical protein